VWPRERNPAKKFSFFPVTARSRQITPQSGGQRNAPSQPGSINDALIAASRGFVSTARGFRFLVIVGITVLLAYYGSDPTYAQDH